MCLDLSESWSDLQSHLENHLTDLVLKDKYGGVCVCLLAQLFFLTFT